jgi:cytochrome c peroxidase
MKAQRALLSIAAYEASAEVTQVTSKYDAVLAGKAQFTTQEQSGYDPVSRQGAM